MIPRLALTGTDWHLQADFFNGMFDGIVSPNTIPWIFILSWYKKSLTD